MRERALLFFTLFAAYAWFFGGSGFNQNSTFDLTRALVEKRQLNIDEYASNTADISRYGGKIYSNKAPGLSVLAAIPYTLIHAMYGPPNDALTLTLYLYFCTVAICGISGALLGVLVAHEALARGATPARANAIALVTGLGTPLFAYSTMLFPHVPAALLIFSAFLLLPRRPIAAGAAAGAATCVWYLCAPLALLLVFFSKSKLRVIAGGVPFALALAAYQFAAFGSPFRTSIATENPAFHEPGAFLGVLHLPQLDALWGITFSPYRGLFFLAPILLLALFALRDRFTWIAFVVLLIINASFFGWHGGYAIGPRYILHIVPFLALGLVRVARWRTGDPACPDRQDCLSSTSPRVKLLLATTLGALSILVNFAVTAVDPQPPDSLRNPVFAYALPSLVTGRANPDEHAPWLHDHYTGHTSTNRVAPDEMLPFQRYAPGSPESEWASFNLGELLFGPGSAASIVPLVVLLSLAAAATFGTRSARSRSA